MNEFKIYNLKKNEVLSLQFCILSSDLILNIRSLLNDLSSIIACYFNSVNKAVDLLNIFSLSDLN